MQMDPCLKCWTLLDTSIEVLFDQFTCRGKMAADNHGCDSILDSGSVDILGQNANCIWEADDRLRIHLEPWGDATISPGDDIRIRPDTLRSENLISDFSQASAKVMGPEFPEAPTISVTGPEIIDPCSELAVTALASSPRPVVFTWACMNDEGLNQALRSLNGSLLYLDSGTSTMQTVDKMYDITVQGTNFLGISSSIHVFRVRKSSVPAPQLSFDPSLLQISRTETAVIKALVAFSQCPMPKDMISFS